MKPLRSRYSQARSSPRRPSDLRLSPFATSRLPEAHLFVLWQDSPESVTVDLAWTVLRKGAKVLLGTVPLVVAEVIRREAGVERPHDAVTLYLCDDARRGDRLESRVGLRDPEDGHAAADEREVIAYHALALRVEDVHGVAQRLEVRELDSPPVDKAGVNERDRNTDGLGENLVVYLFPPVRKQLF